LRQYLTERGIGVHERAPSLEQACNEASLVIHHGGTATLHAAFAAGRPQILWSQVGDQRISATTVDSLGLTVDGPQRLLTSKAVAEAVRRMVADRELALRCRGFAEGVRRRGEHGSLSRILDAAHQLLATS
jgi:UDP:flavonoid glycosyltransferase YjiC (YdhE family)